MNRDTADQVHRSREAGGTGERAPARSPFRRWDARRRRALEQPGGPGSPLQLDGAGLNGNSEAEAKPRPVREPLLERVDADAELSLPPGPRAPAVAQSLSWVRRPVEFMEAQRRKFGPCFRARLGPLRNAVFLSEPDLVKATL